MAAPLSAKDIHPIADRIKIGGKWRSVNGLSFKKIAELIQRFPDFLSIFNSTVGFEDKGKLFLSLGPDVVAAIIVASLTLKIPDEEERLRDEAEALDIPFGEQLDMLDKISEKTFPGGLNPFMDRLRKMMAASQPPSPVRAARPNTGKATSTDSLKPPKSSEQPNTPPSST